MFHSEMYIQFFSMEFIKKKKRGGPRKGANTHYLRDKSGVFQMVGGPGWWNRKGEIHSAAGPCTHTSDA